LWQLGARKDSAGDGPIVVVFPELCLDALLGPLSAQRVEAIEIQLELSFFDPNDVLTGNVYFGFGVQDASRQRVSTEIRLVQSSPIVANYGITQNGNFQSRTQFPGDPRIQIRLERRADGLLDYYLLNIRDGIGDADKGQLLAQGVGNYAPDTRLLPVIYTSGGGVFVVVSKLEFELAPLNFQ
jgi:hypothetical protein